MAASTQRPIVARSIFQPPSPMIAGPRAVGQPRFLGRPDGVGRAHRFSPIPQAPVTTSRAVERHRSRDDRRDLRTLRPQNRSGARRRRRPASLVVRAGLRPGLPADSPLVRTRPRPPGPVAARRLEPEPLHRSLPRLPDPPAGPRHRADPQHPDGGARGRPARPLAHEAARAARSGHARGRQLARASRPAAAPVPARGARRPAPVLPHDPQQLDAGHPRPVRRATPFAETLAAVSPARHGAARRPRPARGASGSLVSAAIVYVRRSCRTAPASPRSTRRSPWCPR